MESIMNNKNRIKQFPYAMEPIDEPIILINSRIINRAIEISRKSPRGRIIFPFHKSPDDTLQRMLNILQPGSYIRPHMHNNPPKSESIIVLNGSICYITFKEWRY